MSSGRERFGTEIFPDSSCHLAETWTWDPDGCCVLFNDCFAVSVPGRSQALSPQPPRCVACPLVTYHSYAERTYPISTSCQHGPHEDVLSENVLDARL